MADLTLERYIPESVIMGRTADLAEAELAAEGDNLAQVTAGCGAKRQKQDYFMSAICLHRLQSRLSAFGPTTPLSQPPRAFQHGAAGDHSGRWPM
jgi:hypothetical protein